MLAITWLALSIFSKGILLNKDHEVLEVRSQRILNLRVTVGATTIMAWYQVTT